MCGARPSRAHLLGRQRDFELDAERRRSRGPSDRRDRAAAAGSPGGRGGIGLAERRQRLRADDPRADAGQEILGEERPERLIFPRLQVARRPVVEQAIAGDMLARLADRDRRAELVAARRSRCRARAHNRGGGSGHIRAHRRRAPCAARSGRITGSPDGAHRACAAVIADRHIFVVGQQRIVGAELLADVGRVMDADVEVGVVADQARHVHPHFALADQLRLDVVAIALVATAVPTGAARSARCASGPRASQALSTGCDRSSRQSSSSRSAMPARSST